MTSAGSRSALFKKRLDPFILALRGIEARDVEALHQARVASRRLREVLPVLELPPDTTRRVAKRLRRVTQRLGRLRELDVLTLLVDDLRRTDLHGAHALEVVADAIREETHQARGWLTRKLPSSKLERLGQVLEDIASQIGESGTVRSSHPHDAKAWIWAMDARVVRRATRLCDSIDEAGALYDAARLHSIRIGLKKCRYAAELSTESRGLDTSPELAALKRTQGILGRLHDFEVLSDRVGRVRDETSERVDLGEFNALTGAIARECRQQHAAFMRCRPELRVIANQLRDTGRRAVTRKRRVG